jgi:hypothetical protein
MCELRSDVVYVCFLSAFRPRDFGLRWWMGKTARQQSTIIFTGSYFQIQLWGKLLFTSFTSLLEHTTAAWLPWATGNWLSSEKTGPSPLFATFHIMSYNSNHRSHILSSPQSSLCCLSANSICCLLPSLRLLGDAHSVHELRHQRGALRLSFRRLRGCPAQVAVPREWSLSVFE